MTSSNSLSSSSFVGFRGCSICAARSAAASRGRDASFGLFLGDFVVMRTHFLPCPQFLPWPQCEAMRHTKACAVPMTARRCKSVHREPRRARLWKCEGFKLRGKGAASHMPWVGVGDFV